MAATVNLDAMIPRADFAALIPEEPSATKLHAFSVEQLKRDSLLVHQLRKPDFQRETSHWTVAQIVTFLKSYLDNELVPSVILWQSPSHVFVIDGGHRISALRAWVEDDYGDGPISSQFYTSSIPADQKRVAQATRRRIESEIGKFALLKEAILNPGNYSDDALKKRARNLITRSLTVQWVEGDAEKAETSFFKINTQGTPLDKTEARLLRERRTPTAIAARSIVRAGTGHKYWSRFSKERKDAVEQAASELHRLLFQPELTEPIKTLDLPLGGRSSPIGALNLLMDFIEIAAAEQPPSVLNQPDETGDATVHTLAKCTKLMRRLTGNDASSLGLHPAVYFYNHRGKHSPHLFLAVAQLFAKAISDNNKTFFAKFTTARGPLERALIQHKDVISQAIVLMGSNQRVDRLAQMLTSLIDKVNRNHSKESAPNVSAEDLLEAMKMSGKVFSPPQERSAKDFADETKSEIYLKKSLESAILCPICSGRVDPQKSLSYDHIVRRSEGGGGVAENGQITHPYCNTGIKG